MIRLILESIRASFGSPFFVRAGRDCPHSRSRALFIAAFAILVPLPCFSHGDVHGRIIEISQRIELQPANAALYLDRAELYRVHQDWDAAQADFDRAYGLNPRLEIIDFARGRMYLEANWPLSAKAALDRFLAKQPNHVEALVVRGRTLAKLERRMDAAQDYTRAINLSRESRPELYIERAQTLAPEGGPYTKEALQGLDQGIQKLGSLVTLQLCAIDLQLKQKDYNGALARLEAITAKSPRKETWLARKGDILQQAGRPQEARIAFKAALDAMETLPPSRKNVPAMLDLQQQLREKLAKPGL